MVMRGHAHGVATDQSSPRSMASQRGSLLLWSLSLSVLMVLSVAGSYPFFQTALRATSFSFHEAQALTLAEAGIEEGLWYLQPDAVYTGKLQKLVVDNFDQTAPWKNPGTARADLDASGQIKGPDILAANNPWFGWSDVAAGSCTADPLQATKCQRTFSGYAGSDGQPIGDVTVTVIRMRLPQPVVTAKASVPSLQNVRAQRTVRAVLAREAFRYAAFGRDRLILGNHVQMDSYSSGQGAYGGTNIGQKAYIGSNGYGSSPEVQIQNTDILVQGKLLVTPDTSVSTPGGAPIEDYVTAGKVADQQDQPLPHVKIPSSLTNLPGYTSPPAGVQTLSGTGRYKIPAGVDWNCTGPTKVKYLLVEGQFQMGPNCELWVENDGSDPWALDTNSWGSSTEGQIIKTETTTTARIFVRNSAFNLDGNGATFDAAMIPDADRDPPLFQLFVTCPTPPCSYPQTPTLAQTKTFYGLVYVEDGSLDIQPGNDNGSTDGTYQGAFVAGKTINVGTAATSKTVYIHYDERAPSVALDGSNTTPTYKILSWEIQ